MLIQEQPVQHSYMNMYLNRYLDLLIYSYAMVSLQNSVLNSFAMKEREN